MTIERALTPDAKLADSASNTFTIESVPTRPLPYRTFISVCLFRTGRAIIHFGIYHRERRSRGVPTCRGKILLALNALDTRFPDVTAILTPGPYT